MSFKRTLGALLATAAIGLSGCQSMNVQKLAELESRMADIDRDGELEKVFLTTVYNPKISKNEYELRIEERDNEGRLKKLEVVRNYGTMDPRTRNYLVFFYSGNLNHLDLVIDGSVR
ncbi:hypothetical protein A3K82_01990 [Candidatus Pacearchaeota archaeon RBG_19FT_COMBO_34_9]|nr:MAG: hypothetical protein A3K82_01990 [Candidatus Pacearchaeota archaeon RBG_19FT_COMBO_34_9]OGJ16751.1 MAG: hypothetical protein A3K74_00865 [Candidatus Pacearchaeota archaeon RBG_13_33_26]